MKKWSHTYPKLFCLSALWEQWKYQIRVLVTVDIQRSILGINKPMCAAVDWAFISSGSGLSPAAWHQTITWDNADVFQSQQCAHTSVKVWIKIQNIFFRAFEIAFCKMPAISKPQADRSEAACSPWTHDVIITSLLRNYVKMTPFWRNDVIIA